MRMAGVVVKSPGRPLVAGRMTSRRSIRIPGHYDPELQVHVTDTGEPIVASYAAKGERTFVEKDPPGAIARAALGTETRAERDPADPVEPISAGFGTATKAEKDPSDPASPARPETRPSPRAWGDRVVTGRVAL